MHVVIFCPPFGGIGGLEVVAGHLARYLERHGHVVTVIARGPRWVDDGAGRRRRLVVPMRQFPRRTRNLLQVGRFATGFGPALARLHRALRAGPQPELLFSLAPPNYAPYPLVLSRILGVPLAVGLHASADLERSANMTIRRLLLRRAALLIPCSQCVAAAAAAAVPSCRARLTVIPNGYDPVDFADAVPARAEGPFLLALGRLVSWKGFDLLIEALARLAPEFPGLHLVVAGDGPEAARLSRLATLRGLDRRVHLPGFTDRATTAGLLFGCELVCCPGEGESFSLVALEAAAAGKAVVAAGAGALPELVRDRETGILVPGRDPAAWAGAVRTLLVDPALRAALGRRAQERVREYTWERVGARYVEALSGVARMCGAGARPLRSR